MCSIDFLNLKEESDWDTSSVGRPLAYPNNVNLNVNRSEFI